MRKDGTVRFRLWAPACEYIDLCLLDQPEPLRMTRPQEGWHESITSLARVGSLYQFKLPGGIRVPDPASRYQPKDVHGPSEVIDPASWPNSDTAWSGRLWDEAILYELHIGTYTPEGTFRAAIGKLSHLQKLGITAIEVMPVGDFPGRRNWGYDGVLPYATDSTYGRPEDFRALIAAAHSLGIMVILDVVYNHFGPDGNYLGLYAPGFFTERHRTPWGLAINFDGAQSRPVREYFIQNAIVWLRDFNLDGLRLDAVHAIRDNGPVHILAELAERVRSVFAGRCVHLILENENNRTLWLGRHAYTAQWNDDAHHVLHTALTGEKEGYYAQFAGDTVKLGRALAQGFVRGDSSEHLTPETFIAFLQNHDQIGNRALGERISHLAPAEAVRAAAAVYLLLPQIPMLFMGEEWGTGSPFPFFCDFKPDLAEAVRKGRRQEFARFREFQDPEQRERIPDPQAPQTFALAKLAWADVDQPPGRDWINWYTRILEARARCVLPVSKRIRRGGKFEVLGKSAVLVHWAVGDTGELVLAANLSPSGVRGFPPAPDSPIWLEGDIDLKTGEFGPWTVAWWLQ